MKKLLKALEAWAYPAFVGIGSVVAGSLWGLVVQVVITALLFAAIPVYHRGWRVGFDEACGIHDKHYAQRIRDYDDSFNQAVREMMKRNA